MYGGNASWHMAKNPTLWVKPKQQNVVLVGLEPTELFGSQRQHHPSVRLRAVGPDSFPESFPNCLEVAALFYQYQSHPLSGGLKRNHQPVADLDNPQK